MPKGRGRVKELQDRKVLLSTLWIFAMFNYLYADVFTLYFNPGLQKDFAEQLATGNFGGMQMTQVSALMFALLMETAMAMLLSRVLDYALNRWTNIIIGAIQTLSVAWSLSGSTPNLFYAFFAAIEIACTLFIVWYAWRWPTNQPQALTSTDSAAQPDSEELPQRGSRAA